jgi:hypothetical protein
MGDVVNGGQWQAVESCNAPTEPDSSTCYLDHNMPPCRRYSRRPLMTTKNQ